jgi:hypothetical protein
VTRSRRRGGGDLQTVLHQRYEADVALEAVRPTTSGALTAIAPERSSRQLRHRRRAAIAFIPHA